MTAEQKEKLTVPSKIASGIWSVAALAGVLIFAVNLSEESGKYVTEGMRIAICNVIPTSFPFMIIADWYTARGGADSLPLLGRFFEKFLGFPSVTIGAYICASLAGFPVGARTVGEMYRRGSLERRSAERLVALCSNPSCAFVVGAVGLGIFGSARVGIALFICVHLSSLLCALIFRQKRTKNDILTVVSRQKFDIVTSVRDAGLSSVSIISFISFFSLITGLIGNHVIFPPLRYAAYALLEVTGGVLFFSSLPSLDLLRPLGVGFVLGFGGFCVMLQSRALVGTDGFSFVPYFFIKLLQGVLCSLLFTLSMLFGPI